MTADAENLEGGIEAYNSREYATAQTIFERLARKRDAYAAFYLGHVYGCAATSDNGILIEYY